MALRIRVLLENHKGAGADKSLKARPGLSLSAEDESTSILFDTGSDGSFMQNTSARGSTCPMCLLWCFRMVITIIATACRGFLITVESSAIPILRANVMRQ